MRFLMLIVAVGTFNLVLNSVDAKPQGGASIAQCVFSGKPCSGDFTTNCCTKFCIVPTGKKGGLCGANPKTCHKNGNSCSGSSDCCSGVCVFRGGQTKKGDCE